MIGLHFDPLYFSKGQMGRWQPPQAADRGVPMLRNCPSVSASRCHLPIWLRKMERIVL